MRPITSQMRDALASLAYSLLPGLNTIIAGGFAADWTQASDVDLWVLGDQHLGHAASVLCDYRIRHASPDTTSDAGDYNGRPLAEKALWRTVTQVETGLRPIQIIGCKETNVDALLESFDISTHRWALGRDGILIAGPDATTVYEDGRVLSVQRSTEARRRRLETRYDIHIEPFKAPTTRKGKAA